MVALYRVTDAAKIQCVLATCRKVTGDPHHRPPSSIRWETPCSVDTSTVFDRNSVVTHKADGDRYLLLLTTFDDRPVACLVNRANAVYTLHLRAPRSWYEEDTCFDGELCVNLHDAAQQVYLVFNVLRSCGESCFHTAYGTRLNHVQQCVTEMTCDCDDITVACKQWVVVSHVSSLAPSTMYATDGYVISPIHGGMTAGRNVALKKWKEVHTIDVRLLITADNRFKLMALQQGVEIALGDALPHHTFEMDDALASIVRGQRFVQRVFGESEAVVFDEIVELTLHADSNRLSFLRLRRDKPTANDIVTINNTVRAAQVVITRDDIHRRLCSA
jgi:hypothetical protein